MRRPWRRWNAGRKRCRFTRRWWPTRDDAAGRSDFRCGAGPASRRSRGRGDETISLAGERSEMERPRAGLRVAQLMMSAAISPRPTAFCAKPSRKRRRSGARSGFLIGRLNLAQGHPEKAIETLSVILKRPEGVSHSLLIATLFELADAHLAAKDTGKRRRRAGGIHRSSP